MRTSRWFDLGPPCARARLEVVGGRLWLHTQLQEGGLWQFHERIPFRYEGSGSPAEMDLDELVDFVKRAAALHRTGLSPWSPGGAGDG